MKFSTQIISLLAGAASIASVTAHPERLTEESAKRELVGRASDKCARQIEARKEATLKKRQESFYQRRVAEGKIKARNLEERVYEYATIQNDTCVLAPEAVWGPYAIDEEIYRHDVREGQSGVDFYLDIGIIDVETCEPLPDAWLTIWHCNATGTYSGFTKIDPNTASLYAGDSTNTDGTTDEETFLRGVMNTDSEGMAEFLTIFPGYYITRTTHIHLTVQTNVSNNDSSYSAAAVQHVGQLFFNESLINSVYELEPYNAHLSTLNRTLDSEDSLYTSSQANGYSSVISVQKLGASIADGLVGYITVGVNASAAGVVTEGGSVNVLGVIPTLSIDPSARATAYVADEADGYKVLV